MKKHSTLKKVFSLIGIILCILLLVFVGLGEISWLVFWIGTGILAVFAYLMLPRMD